MLQFILLLEMAEQRSKYLASIAATNEAAVHQCDVAFDGAA
jgi:hypothetical protein